MLNTYNQKINNQTEISINACSGGIYKTYKESFIKRFHLKSELSNEVLSDNPTMLLKTGKSFPEKERIDIVIVQVVICGDMEVIAEIIKKEDFDKYFKEL